jgi:hypothetical protein
MNLGPSRAAWTSEDAGRPHGGQAGSVHLTGAARMSVYVDNHGLF